MTRRDPGLTVDCPRCNATTGKHCTGPTGKRVNTHAGRLAAAVVPRTPDAVAADEHSRRQFEAQWHPATLVTVSFGYSCGCSDTPSEPIPLREANTYAVGRTIICDTHNEYAVVTRSTVRLIADEPTMLRILRSADVDPLSARHVARDQNDTVRHRRILAGRDPGPA